MEKELILLREIHLNPQITQRDMARVAGLSLGGVNFLVKKMINTGFVKAEKTKRKTAIYSLTPLGLDKKAEATYKYFCEAYTFFKKFNENIDRILVDIKKDKYFIVLFGEKDDICELISMKLISSDLNYLITDSVEKIKELSKKNEIVSIVWQPEVNKLLKDIKIYKCINLLNYI